MTNVVTENRCYQAKDVWFCDRTGKPLTDLEAFIADEVWIDDGEVGITKVVDMPGTGYVNVYEVSRHYGGPEEGGWWYNHAEPIASSPVLKEHAQAELERLESMYNYDGNIYSVNGTYEDRVCFEFYKGEPTPRPHYE